jgi:hypothetical protein
MPPFFSHTGAIYKMKERRTAAGQQNYQNTQRLEAGRDMGEMRHFDCTPNLFGCSAELALRAEPLYLRFIFL